MEVSRNVSVAIRKARTNSRAVLESSPFVELQRNLETNYESHKEMTYLSQDVMQLLVARASAMDTRFFSPPLTPRIKASPTGVFRV
jgi:hypothetical protein